MVQSIEHVTLNLRIVSSSPILSIEPILKKIQKTHWKKITIFHFLKILLIYFRERECEGRGRGRERILSRVHAQHRAQRGAWSHNPEIMTWSNSWVRRLIDWTIQVLLPWVSTSEPKKSPSFPLSLTSRVYGRFTVPRNWHLELAVSKFKSSNIYQLDKL